jgi:hypothetical protein
MRALSATVLLCFTLTAAEVPPEAPTPAREKTLQKAPLETAVDEFRVQTANLGRPGSQSVAAKYHGPRPQWHGRIYENFRNDALDAVPHQIVQRGEDKSLLRRNQFGFNVAGPVVIPKLYNGSRSTFFSVSYEGVRERISRANLLTVATEGERAGDFSRTVDLSGNALPIYDPRTTRANPNYDSSIPVSTGNLQYIRDPFPGNRIPTDRLDPKAVDAVGLYPHANSNAGPFDQNNYFVVSPETNTADGFIFKLDHSIGERHKLSFSGSTSNGTIDAAPVIPNAADSSPVDRQFQSRSGNLQYVATISPRTFNTFSFLATDNRNANTSDLFPMYHFGYLPMGKWNAQGRRAEANYTFSDSLSAKRGKHSLRFSAQYFGVQVTSYSNGDPLGYYEFGSGITSLPGVVNTGHPFASFLLGMAQYAEQSEVMSPSYFRRSLGSAAVRDQYEIRSDLTITASLNLQASAPRTEKYDRQTSIDFNVMNPENGAPGALVAAGTNGVGRAFQPVRTVLEPSIGLAWNPLGNSRRVVRAGYSRSYTPIPIGWGQFATQGYNGSPNYISANAQLDAAAVLSQGLPPSTPLPDLRPDAVNNMIADYIEPTGRLPRYQSATLTYEQQLPASTVVTLGFGHSDGKNMFAGENGVNLNAISLDDLSYRDALNNEDFRKTLRPYPQYVNFETNGLYPIGRYQRDGGYVKVEKRSDRGLLVTATYEYAKQMDDYYGPGIQDFFNRDNDWSRTAYVSPHRFSMTYVYELPFGPGKSLFSYSDWRRLIVEGWSLSGMTAINSGDPLILRPMFNNTGGVVRSLNVNVVPGVEASVPNQSANLWFNPAAFTQPDDFTIGNASRTSPTLLGPGSQNNDLSIAKRISLDGERALEFSAVGFNFTNHANWTEPDTVIGSAAAPNLNAGKIIGSVGGRVIQLGLRYSF